MPVILSIKIGGGPEFDRNLNYDLSSVGARLWIWLCTLPELEDVEALGLYSTTVHRITQKVTNQGACTATNSESRRVVPEDVRGRPVMKVVYVVLESQYQSSMTAAVKRINAGSDNMAVECVGYLLEELRNDDAYEQFQKDMLEANIFVGSHIFVQELAEKVVEVVNPLRNK